MALCMQKTSVSLIDYASASAMAQVADEGSESRRKADGMAPGS